ncbi:MAG TPA: DsbC family protein [Wenzhouxiangella sp.]|nr:DsbC family protein [Wenzhouxiangella sp.]
MRTFIPTIVVSLIALIIASAAVADQDAITQRVSGLVPEIETLNIAETPLPGVMEVQVNGEIIYMSEDGRYLMQGRLVDMNTQTDLTDAAKSVLRREAVSQLDDDKMVIFGNDDADYELMVFTDVDCGYCRRLHQQIEEYTEAGIRVKYMAFPRAGIGSETYDKMVSIWCADDPRGAMTVAKSGQQPAPARCDNPVEEQYRLGKQLGVTGTPSLITPNGEMIPGYVPPQQLRERLDQLTQARSAGN